MSQVTTGEENSNVNQDKSLDTKILRCLSSQN